MIKNLAIITNTNSVNSDLWKVHCNQVRKYFKEPHYVFSDTFNTSIKIKKFIPYNKEEKFRTQFLSCIGQIEEEYCLYLNEDYLIYDKPDYKKLQEYVNVLEGNSCLSFIRLAKGMDAYDIPFSNTLQYLDCRNNYFFSQTASLWRTSHLLLIHKYGPDLHIAGKVMNEQFEVAASDVARSLGIQGLYHYDGESKRGTHHYDSKVFPYTASALVKGKWNLSEYGTELQKLKQEHGIDFSKRSHC